MKSTLAKSCSIKKALTILICIVGILSIGFGIAVIVDATNFSGNTGDYSTFGADFYTIVNKNAASVAYNTRWTVGILKTVCNGLGFMLIIAGLVTSAKALIACCDLSEEKKKAMAEEAVKASAFYSEGMSADSVENSQGV